MKTQTSVNTTSFTAAIALGKNSGTHYVPSATPYFCLLFFLCFFRFLSFILCTVFMTAETIKNSSAATIKPTLILSILCENRISWSVHPASAPLPVPSYSAEASFPPSRQ